MDINKLQRQQLRTLFFFDIILDVNEEMPFKTNINRDSGNIHSIERCCTIPDIF